MTRSRRELRKLCWLTWLCLLALLIAPLSSAARGAPVATPTPIEFPRDDGAHDSRIEWWYFTGHLMSADGERYGFEFVIFRARQGDLEGYVSHFAVTDQSRGTFQYDQRILGARGVRGDEHALDLDLDGWMMRGGGGDFVLAAEMPGYGLTLEVATTKPAALHEGDGHIEYGDGTASYYYSWTRLAASGQLDVDGESVPVRGSAWMDHQWGDFATYEGGWDWFAIQLDDGRDIMLYAIRGPNGEPAILDGSIVAADGALTVLSDGDFAISPTGSWTSEETGTTYPSGWHVDVPAAGLALTVTPVLLDQEMDTRPTTGVIYWEGAASVAGSENGGPVSGDAYVELTGYAPYTPLDLATPGAASDLN